MSEVVCHTSKLFSAMNILNFHSELDQTWNFKSMFYVENISLTKQNEQRIDRNDVFFISFAKKKIYQTHSVSV